MSFFENSFPVCNGKHYLSIDNKLYVERGDSSFDESSHLENVELKEEFYQLHHDKQKLLEDIEILNKELEVYEQKVVDLTAESMAFKRESASVLQLREENQLLEKTIGLQLQELTETKEDNVALRKTSLDLKEDLSQTRKDCLNLSQTVSALENSANCQIAYLLEEEKVIKETIVKLKRQMTELETLAFEMHEVVDTVERVYFEDHYFETPLQSSREHIQQCACSIANQQANLSDSVTIGNVVIADADECLVSVSQELVSALHLEDKLQLEYDFRGTFFKPKPKLERPLNTQLSNVENRARIVEASEQTQLANEDTWFHPFHHQSEAILQQSKKCFRNGSTMSASSNFISLVWSALVILCALFASFALICNCSEILSELYGIPIPSICQRFQWQPHLRIISIVRTGPPPM